jgi:hypothetical protein
VTAGGPVAAASYRSAASAAAVSSGMGSGTLYVKLHGMLKEVRDLGMPLLSVNRVGDVALVQGNGKGMTALV